MSARDSVQACMRNSLFISTASFQDCSSTMPAAGPGAATSFRHDYGGSITFLLNGTKHTVKCDLSRYNAHSTLSEYIRDIGFTGVKTTCLEGGCGACAVTVTVPDVTGKSAVTTYSISACLCPLFSVDGWQITTTEGLGSQKTGFHPIQKRVAKFNGSQCGYCTPGMVMNMYGLLQKNPKPTEQEIEDSFDGNLCRCTGYRAILDAMKSFGANSSIPGGGVIDIEDLNKHLCKRTELPCAADGDHTNGSSANGASANGASANGAAGEANGSTPQCGIGQVTKLNLQLSDGLWFRPTSLSVLGELLQKYSNSQVKMLVGNTATGIYKDENVADVHIDIKYVRELSETKVTDIGVSVGANTSLTDFIDFLQSCQDSQPGFAYFSALVQHLKLVGNVLVRNVGGVGGNLMIKYTHPDFPSDLFTMLEGAGATLEIYDPKDQSLTVASLMDFATKVNMQGKVLKAVQLKAFDVNDRFRTYKITPRTQNAHAYVNAAFRFKVTEDSKQILGRPALVFGGIDDKTIHADMTEQFLTGREITSATVKDAIAVLKSELSPSSSPLLSSPEYRRDLAANLLYKTLLGLSNASDSHLESGSTSLLRPLSSAIQTFQEKTEEWPLKQPMPKVTSLLQASGEAQFVNDIPRFQRELCAAFVLSTVANARLLSVDPSPALALPGVHSFISASDISGENKMHTHTSFEFTSEELFSTGKINYAGQPIGLILAESESLANKAAQLVDVKYTDIQPPILTIQEGIAANSFHPLDFKPRIAGQPDEALTKAKNIVEGEVTMGTQYHFYLENNVSLCVPSEDGVDMYSAVQYADILQSSVAAVLGKPVNYVNVNVPRVGGGFGGKARLACVVASAAAVAATTTNRPVRLSMSLSSNMALAGKRFPVLAKYKVGFSDEGVLEAVQLDIYVDGGNTESNRFLLLFLMENIDHGYYCPNWKVTPYLVRTDKPTCAACRGPGHVPASLIIEAVMEHVAKAVHKHPILVKELNLYQKHQTDLGFGGHVLTYCTMRDVWKQLKDVAEVETRLVDVQNFNAANRWKKRALTMSAVKHGMFWGGPTGTGYPAQVSIFGQDGTVTVSQSGVEMGQGLYTKVAQAVAHALGIPIDLIKVRPNQTIIANNAFETGGSSTSEQCVHAVLECCKILRERLAPIKNKYPDADWVTLIRKALQAKIDLGARFTNFGEPGSPFFNYFTYCAGVYETELDVLTGEYQIRRVDIMYDCGESLNPLIDIGQIEGAFVMGLGCHLLEDIVYDPETGRVLNDGTWEYNIPSSKDIPIDWRVHLLPDAPNPVGVRSSKAVGEPPLALACGPLLALKQCMETATHDLTGSSPFIPVDSPLTVEKLQRGCKVTVDKMEV